jgi:hypothetical protein
MATLTVRDPRTIQRVVLKHGDDVEAELRGEVLTKAYELFGYQADTFKSRGPLAATLAKLSIAPLDQTEVDLYKKSKEKKWTVNYRMTGFVVFNVAWPFLTIGAVLALKAFFSWHEVADFTTLDGVCIGFAVLTLFGYFVGNSIISDELKNVRYTRDWKTWPLGKKAEEVRNNGNARTAERYPRYVPVHLLNLAVSIKQTLPAARFYVEELQVTHEDIPKPLPDPFLVVTHGSERYTIGVWDEREFEAKA